MDDDSLLVRLQKKAEYHAHEAERFRIAAEVVREEERGGTRGAPLSRRTPSDPRHSTMTMITTVLGDTDAPLDLDTLTARIQEEGWQTESTNPRNTVRTATRRLAERGVLKRTPEGSFALAPEDSEAPGDGDSQEAPTVEF